MTSEQAIAEIKAIKQLLSEARDRIDVLGDAYGGFSSKAKSWMETPIEHMTSARIALTNSIQKS